MDATRKSGATSAGREPRKVSRERKGGETTATASQWYTQPDPLQETPRERTAMEIDPAHLLPELGAVVAWTPRDRVIVKWMTRCLARERQCVFVEEEEMETYRLSPTNAEGTLGVFARSVCAHEGRRRFVATKVNKTTPVANGEAVCGDSERCRKRRA